LAAFWRHSTRRLVSGLVGPRGRLAAIFAHSTHFAIVMETQLIKYMGNRKTPEGSTVYVFLINGLQKELKEASLKQHPGCYQVLPASVKDSIEQNRQWISKI
jgi:hypothetical protein